ncbi:AAA family ATPase [Bradyrhizobium sp. CSA112]|uniref:AAA family ATPase n=1 Tax=Bradyrhizobium sp. CSA112 TaxID=2699170 RepID=UPI0023B14B0C|nr:AAA family ATPase [Bradyrhizobium sp. CSA112]MDE5451310.1 AAA family ATPase [Bradyrhizobium sp. CSA112]
MNAVVQPIYTPDVAAMRNHVEHLFGGYLDGCHEGLIELSWTDTKADESGRYRLNNARLFGTDQLDDLVEEAARLNSQPMCNVYIGAALRHADTAPFGRAKDTDAWALTCAYVDLDDPGVATAAKEIYGTSKPTMVVVTGWAPHTRAQMWWRLDEPLTDSEAWPALLRGMAAAMKGDPTVTNPSRVMRLAGTIAWPVKQGRKTELTSIAPLREPGQPVYAFGQLAGLFPPVGASSVSAAPSARLNYTTNSLGLADKINDGREGVMVKTINASLVHFIGENGCTPSAQELFDGAWSFYEKKVDLTRSGRGADEFAKKCAYTVARFERGDIRGIETIDKAIEVYQRKQVTQAERPQSQPAPSVHSPKATGIRFPFETIGMLRKLPAPLWLAKDWVPEGATGIFYGKWAAGKSFIGFDFLLHLAYGFKEWHGVPLPGEPCHVLVLAREGHHGFVNRVDAFKKHHNITDDTDRIHFMRAAVSFMRDDEFNGLLDAVAAQKIQYRCILVDTVARVLPGTDMNEQQVVTLFMERLQILGAGMGAATIGVHHENKNGGMMGSIYFEANADFVFEVTRVGEEDEPLTRGEIMCTKQKDGEDRWKRSVRYKKVELSIMPEGPTSLVVEAIGEPAKQQNEGWPDKDTCRRVVRAIDEAWISGKPWSFEPQAKRAGRYAPKLISQGYQINPKLAENMIEAWLMNDVLSVEIRDAKSKMRGLKVIGQI